MARRRRRTPRAPLIEALMVSASQVKLTDEELHNLIFLRDAYVAEWGRPISLRTALKRVLRDCAWMAADGMSFTTAGGG